MSELNRRTEMTLADIAISREQQIGVLYNQAVNVLNSASDEDIREVEADESIFLASANTTYGSESRYLGSIHDYAVATLIDGASGEVPAGSPIYLIIDDNFLRPIVQFERYDTGKSVAYLGDENVDIKDAAVASILDYLLAEHKSRKSTIEASNNERQNDLRKRRLALVGLVAVAGVAVGVIQGVTGYHNAQDRAAAEEIEAFDDQNIQLPGTLIAVSETGYAASLPELFEDNDVPSTGSDITGAVRSFEITAGSCIAVGSANASKEVVAVTDGADDVVIIARASDGSIEACALDGNYNDQDLDELNVAIQTR